MTLTELKKLHDKTCAICREVMVKKNSDYTGGTKAKNIFANFESARYLGIHPVQGIMMRIMDKIQRINSFTNDKELQVPNESVYDACEDIVNYAILAKAILTEERKDLAKEKEEVLLADLVTYLAFFSSS